MEEEKNDVEVSETEPVENTDLEENEDVENQEEELPQKTQGENLKSKDLQSALAQKEHYRKKYEELKKQPKVVQSAPAGEDEWRSKVDFLIKNRDYNEEEFDHIASVAQRKGLSIEDAAKAESDYIAFRRQKVAEQNKIPSSSQAGSSQYSKRISADTPAEEIDKVLEERFKKASSEGKSGY
jgi:hypothetical protein